MKLIINIPLSVYENIINGTIETDGYFKANLRECFKNGTLLPEHHGRLIDADALNARMEQRINEIGDDKSIWEASGVETALDMFAPTIIEADKEGKE